MERCHSSGVNLANTLCLSFVNQYFSSLALCSTVFFALPVFFNCSHAHKAQPISLWVPLINMVQREEKQSTEEGPSVKRRNLGSRKKNTLGLSPFSLFMALQPHMKIVAVRSSTPTTGGAPASARDFPTLVSLYKLRSVTKAPAGLQRSEART